MAKKLSKAKISPPDPTPGPKEAPQAVPRAQRPSNGSLTCVVCRKPFERAVNLRKKAKVCTPFEFDHKRVYAKQPDGTIKIIPCGCCRCLYKKTMSKNRSLDGKLIPIARVPEFFKLTQALYPEVHLAFRVGLAAMLRVTELSDIQVSDLDDTAKPVPRLQIAALKKTVKMHFPVDIASELARQIRAHVGSRTEGKIFDIPVRTLQHKFTQIMKKMELRHLSIHALRHTGITNVARTVKTMDELNYLRKQARHESIETTKLYMGFEDHQRLDMMQRVKVF